MPQTEGLAEHQVSRPAAWRGCQVELVEDGRFRIIGSGVNRLVLRYDVKNEEAMATSSTASSASALSKRWRTRASSREML